MEQAREKGRKNQQQQCPRLFRFCENFFVRGAIFSNEIEIVTGQHQIQGNFLLFNLNLSRV